MLDVHDALSIVRKSIPDGKIQSYIQYEDLFIFQIFSDDQFEGEFDPFYSVNRSNGEFQDFSIITDGDIKKIDSLFQQARRR